MLKFYVFLLVLNGLAYGQFRLCPPSCKLPESARECRTFFKRASCSEDIIDLSMPEAQCACLWQTYIQNTEQAGTVIFTKDGRSCYSWAVKTCAYMERKATPSPWLQMNGISIAEEKTSVFGNDQFDRLVEQLKTLASSKENNVPKKEVAKHRKRNGVDNILMGYSPKQSEGQKGEKSSQQKQESQPRQQQQQKQGSQQKQQQKQESQPQHKQQQKQESQPQQKQQQKQESQPQQKQEGPHPQKPIVTRIEEAEVVRSFIGSVGQSKSGQWFVIEPERTTPVNNCTTAPVEHWIDIRIPVNQFKLGVFLLILLLNTLFVVVLIFCRRSTPKKRQQKPAGDLAVPMERPDQDASQQEYLAKSKRQKKQDVELSLPETPEKESPEKETPEKESPEKIKQNLIALHFIDTWRKKIQEKKKKKKSKENMKKNSKESLKSKDNQYLQLDNCEDETAHCYTENHPTYYNADMFWPQKGNVSLGIYEELSEDLGSSDTMYEVAMPSPEEPSLPYLPKRCRVDFSSTDSSPTKNLPRSPDKRFHFAVPPGTYITLQDRMVPPIQKRSKKTKKGIGMTHRTNLKRISKRSRSAKRHIQSKNMSTINHRSLWGN